MQYTEMISVLSRALTYAVVIQLLYVGRNIPKLPKLNFTGALSAFS